MSSTTPGSEPERPHDGDLPEPTASEPDAALHDEPEPPAAPAASEPEPEPEPEPPAAPAASEPEPDAAPDVPEAPEPPAWVEPDGTADTAVPAHSGTPEDSVEPEPAAAEPAESPDATARLDEAVQRANAAPVASDLDDTGEAGDVPEPVAADSVRRETYVPSATVAAGTAAGAATLAPEPDAVYVAPQPGPQTVYVQAPTPPKSRGNRAFGVLVALIGAVAFALLYAGVAYLLLLGQTAADEATSVFAQFVTRPVYWVPIVAFFLGFTILAAIVNRGGWWYYAVFGLIVAALVYFSYLGGALLTVEAWTLTVDEARDFISQRWLDPFAIVAFIIAREIPIWLGGWIAARGRTVTERNRVAIEEYDRELAAGPQPQR